MVIPNTATIALTLDKPSYRARETVAVSAAIVNTGKFDLNDMAVTITIPDAGYSETISTGILVGQKATVPFSFTIPNTITPGLPYGKRRRSVAVRDECDPNRRIQRPAILAGYYLSRPPRGHERFRHATFG